MSVIDRLVKIGRKVKDDKLERVKSIMDDASEREIDLLIKNHSLSMAELARELNISAVWCKEKVREALAKGVLPDILQASNKRYMLTLEHAHIIADLMGDKAPSWQQRVKQKSVIVVSSQKGGVGKSQTAISLASGMALPVVDRMRTLLIDLDPQGSQRVFCAPTLTSDSTVLTAVDLMLGEVEPESMYAQFRKKGVSHERIVKASVLKTHIPNFDILPAFTSDERLNAHVWSHAGTTSKLDDCISLLKNKVVDVLADEYDTIIIDTPPTNNPLVWSALECATFLLIPSATQELVWASNAEYIEELPSRLSQLPSKARNMRDFKVVATLFDDEKTLDNVILQRMQQKLGSDLLNSTVVRSAAFEVAARNFRTVWDIKKADKLCPTRQLEKAMSSLTSLRRDVMMNMIRQDGESR